jgi:hypothetical protein
MKVEKLKKERAFLTKNYLFKNIQSFGEDNDYPQQLQAIVGGSVTLGSCISTYSRFIGGSGFTDTAFGQLTATLDGKSMNSVLWDLADDFALFGGCYLHVNYNANHRITSVCHVDYETVRFSAIRPDGSFDKFVLHPDWARQFVALHNWGVDDEEFVDKFNPDPDVIDAQVMEAGGWDKYKGQILFFTTHTGKSYPVPRYVAELTDGSTEQGLCNVTYRSARNNFITAGVFVNVGKAKEETEGEKVDLNDNLSQLQGDTNACKVASVDVDSKDEVPTFVNFNPQNFDAQYKVSNDTVKDRIGRAFNQPPILRAEDVGSNFGSTLMETAYNYYNSYTSRERLQIGELFQRVAELWKTPITYQPKVQELVFRHIYTPGEISSLVQYGVLTPEEGKQQLHYDPTNSN